jgi:plastocyanin
MRVTASVTALLAVAILAACGGGSSPSQPAGSTAVTMTEFKFDPSSITVKNGNVTFWLINSGTTAHDMAIVDSSGKIIATSELLSAGDSKAFTVNNLESGSYTFYCTQPGHKASGMTGTLTVT